MASTSKKAVTSGSAFRKGGAAGISDKPGLMGEPRKPAERDAQDETFVLMLAELDGRLDEIERRTDRLIARHG